MAWRETCAVKERRRFVSAWEREWEECEGRVNMAALCRAFDVSRVTGYKWIKRYLESGRKLDSLEEQSRRPTSSPNATPEIWVDAVIWARNIHPRWGARKLRRWLWTYVRRRKGFRGRLSLADLPQPSTITAILRRNGLTFRRVKRRRTPPSTQPFQAVKKPNDTWCADFKGHFRTRDGIRVYPLTIMDAASRYLIRCELVLEPSGKHVMPIFESAFKEFGLPKAIRTDNGPPFASTGPGGLTELSAWWIRLGLRHERIEPGKPQQNGRHERMHLTLKQETAMPPAASPSAQQRRFNFFRRVYNEERPHEALGLDVPASLYERSKRSLPEHIPTLEYQAFAEIRRVEKDGTVELHRSRVRVGAALYGEFVAFMWIGERRWEVYYGPIVLGLYDQDRPSRGLLAVKRRLDDDRTDAAA